jgi:hypothetical protein
VVHFKSHSKRRNEFVPCANGSDGNRCFYVHFWNIQNWNCSGIEMLRNIQVTFVLNRNPSYSNILGVNEIGKVTADFILIMKFTLERDVAC